MKKTLRLLAIVLIATLTVGLCACSKPTGDGSSCITSDLQSTEINSTVQDNASNVGSDAVTSQEQVNSNTSQSGSDLNESENQNSNLSAEPNITLFASVANDIYVLGGNCSINTEYISVKVESTTVKVKPAMGEGKKYFIAQVKIPTSTTVEIQAKESGKELSETVSRVAFTNPSMIDYTTQSDYSAVFGKDSRMHFYSALLCYSMSDFVDSDMKAYAKGNITATVNAAKSNGAEVIYLVIPSSAAVYPETVPDEYKEAKGESLYDAFYSVATSCGAKVMYPLEVMKSHKNDGEGYKIYSHTDSHWTTYGAYFGVSELMNYISASYPAAKPRTIGEMGFYTTELYGGDALFSFGNLDGFENQSGAAYNNGATNNTKINELTTLYSKKMPTDTLSGITRNKKSAYLTKANEGSQNFTNPNGSGLPSAVIVRDSFGRTAYDMVNDRFSKVTWLAEGDYTSTVEAINQNKPNYVIYIVSERNLLKVMFNSDVRLVNYK